MTSWRNALQCDIDCSGICRWCLDAWRLGGWRELIARVTVKFLLSYFSVCSLSATSSEGYLPPILQHLAVAPRISFFRATILALTWSNFEVNFEVLDHHNYHHHHHSYYLSASQASCLGAHHVNTLGGCSLPDHCVHSYTPAMYRANWFVACFLTNISTDSLANRPIGNLSDKSVTIIAHCLLAITRFI